MDELTLLRGPNAPDFGDSASEPHHADEEGGLLVHPVVIARVGGEPANLFEHDNGAVTAQAIGAIDAQAARLGDLSGEICAALERHVSVIDDDRIRQRIIQLKRDLFNQRAVQMRADVEQALSPELAAAVANILSQFRALSAERDRIESIYADEVNVRREHVRKLFNRDNLRLGILASNPLLYEQLKKLTGSLAPIPSGKKAAYPFDSLVSFASRASLKSSPLSSFTLIWAGDWSGQSAHPAEPNSAADLPYARKVEIKHAALLHALEPIWSDRETLGSDFPLSINPTLRRVGNELKWNQIYRSAYRHSKVWGHNAPEVTVALASVGIALRLFQEAGASQLTAAELVEQLETIERNEGNRQNFVDRLLSLQLLVPAFERHDQEPLLPWLIALVGRMGTDKAKALVAHLESLRDNVDRFAQADEADRAGHVERINAALEKLVETTQVPVKVGFLTPAVFEDCFVTNERLQFDLDEWGTIHQDLFLLLRLAPVLDFNHVMQSLIARRFCEEFGPDGQCERADLFLETVIDTYFGSESEVDPERMKRLHDDQLSLPVGRRIHDIRQAYHDHFAKVPVVDNCIQLSRDVITQLGDALPASIRARHLSQNFTGQLIRQGSAANIFVINQVLPGATGLMSRFMGDLDEHELSNVSHYLTALAPTGNPVEIPSVFGFNANLHPSLVAEEIAVPGITPGFRDTEKLDIRGMSVTYDRRADRIVLRHGGRAIDPFYFGFLSPMLLPQRLRVLTMTSTQNKLLYVSREIEKIRGLKQSEVSRLPRIMFGSICLARASTVFPQSKLPDPNLSDGEFFAAVTRWRREWDLPRHAYWRLLQDFSSATERSEDGPRSAKQGMDQALKGQAVFDPTAFKPAFIDFVDPLFVRIFRRSLARNHFDLAIEEALPEPDQHHLRIGAANHLLEMQFEISRTGSKVA